MLNSTEHEISTGHKTKTLKNKYFSSFKTPRCYIYRAYNTVNPLYNDTVCSKLSLTLKVNLLL